MSVEDSRGMDSASTSSSSIDRVSVKVPEFIPSDPELWFAMLESSFDAAGIKRNSTKLGYALGALDQKHAIEVRDIIVQPKTEQSYEHLKCELIKRLGSSQDQKTRRLLENEPIGDRKPSQFLRHLRGLAGVEIPDEVLQTLWLKGLPQHIQGILAAHKDLTLDKRADIADSVAEAYRIHSNISEASSSATSARMDYLESALSKALKELAAIKQSLRELRPSSGAHHNKKHIFVFKDLANTTHVFVRHDSTRQPLQQPYNGPYEVKERRDRTFVVRINGQDKTISIDRLKPAFIVAEGLTTDLTQPEDVSSSPTSTAKEDQYTTRSGRQVRFPDRLQGGFR
ncbi:hypothetical protein NQ315_012909 [Exocentrus adspersus]|uniref:DUF7041 domain-containing protein n=1 Tax=Exocentrus adspersus TaxID=1586481 RepID=A0AAV8VSJ5_9CUCU|nr:hypothetical protein NQ315_012909 [Exocentrus adspersus]